MDPLLRSFEALVASDPGAPAVLVHSRGSRDVAGDGRFSDGVTDGVTGRVTGRVSDRLAGASRDTVTREQLERRARRLGSRWAEAGLARDHVVVLGMPPGAEFLAAWMAIRRAGACALLVDPGLREVELQKIEDALPPDFRVVAQTSQGTEVPCGGSELELVPSVRTAGKPARPDAIRGAAIVKLTSGTSGIPRGVIMRPEQLLADGLQLRSSMGLVPVDRFLCIIPFTHSYGFSLLPTSLFLWGCPLIVPGTEDPLECARHEGATVLPAVPAWYRARLRTVDESFHWPASLRLYVTAGEPMAPSVAQAWRKASGRPVQALYGSSECGGIAFDRTGASTAAGRVGVAVEGVTLDLSDDSEIQPSETRRGTVTVHSKAVAAGYWTDSTSLDPRLRPAEEPGAMGTFHTEDIGQFQGAELELLGRLSAWINVNGKKIDPREVEATILRMDGVDEVAVLGVKDESGVERLRAVVASRAESPPNYLEVSAWCRQNLAAFKVPRSILVVPALPRNERGKVDTASLSQP